MAVAWPSCMGGSSNDLAAFLREHPEIVLATWEDLVARTPELVAVARVLGRDDVTRMLQIVASVIERPAADNLRDAVVAASAHVVDHAELAVQPVALAADLVALRCAAERAWPGSSRPEARDALRALRCAFDRVLIGSLEHYHEVRLSLLDTIDAIVRAYPAADLAHTLEMMLRTIRDHLRSADTAAILLAEDHSLRVRASIGFDPALEFRVALGEGFAGLVAAERKPRLLRDAANDPIIRNPAIRDSGLRALYGIPLLRGDELLGVAHMGSRSASEFSEESKALFRMIMERVAGVLYQEIVAERLAIERARHGAVVDSAPTIIFSKDLDGRFLTFNRHALDKLGVSPDQLIGKTVHDLFPPEIAGPLASNDQRLLETRAAFEVEETVLQHSERRIYLTVKFPIFDPTGALIATGGVSTDITDRRRAERGQRMLAEAGGLLVASLEFEETVRQIARRIVPLLADCCVLELVDEHERPWTARVEHAEPDKRVLAQGLAARPIDRDRPHLADAVLRAREPVFMPEVPGAYLDTVAQDADQRQVLRALAPTSMIQLPLSARDHLLGALILMRCGAAVAYDRIDLELAVELGLRISLALENARLYRIARRAIRAREQMLGTVAHDLRNPINAIAIATAALEHELPPDAVAAHRRVEAIGRAVKRTTKLVGDLLDQHAIESGQLTLERRGAPACGLVRDAAEAARGRIAAASLALEVDLDDALPQVLADPDRIAQVFENLVSNAVKFTPAGGTITFSAHARGDDVLFAVTDTGSGITDEALPHLFDRFWRARRADRRGAGLGLAICKGIVEAHGGQIWAEHAPTGGARVCFTLRRAR